jgi:hypothetical protein
MEEAKWDEANDEKVRLEDKQRTVRKKREAEYALKHPNMDDQPSSSSGMATSQSTFFLGGGNGSVTKSGAGGDDADDMSVSTMTMAPQSGASHDPDPAWFRRTVDPYTNQPIHLFKNEYWDCKAGQDWSRCPDLF